MIMFLQYDSRIIYINGITGIHRSRNATKATKQTKVDHPSRYKYARSRKCACVIVSTTLI